MTFRALGGLGKLRFVNDPTKGKSTLSHPYVAPPELMPVMNLDASSYAGGPLWLDSSGNGNHATLLNSPVWNPGGWFTVSGQEIATFSDLSLPLGNSERTISLWVNFSTAFGNTWAFTYGSAWWGQLVAIGQVSGNFYVAGYSAELITGVPVVPGNWYNYVVTYNPSTIAKVYVNGSLIYNNSPIGFAWFTIASGAGYVGSYPPWAQAMNGYIGQILVYNKELSGGEIVQKFNSSKAKYGL